MTEEALLRANKNREKRAEKLKEYEKISRMHDNTSDSGIISCMAKVSRYEFIQDVYPTPKELRDFLEAIRNRLDAEISALDEEFSGL